MASKFKKDPTNGLVTPLIESITRMLPVYQDNTKFTNPEVAEMNRKCLVKLSISAMDTVIRQLADLLRDIVALSVSKIGDVEKREASQQLVLKTISECLQQDWCEKGQTSTPVDDELAGYLVDQIAQILKTTDPATVSLPGQLGHTAGRLLFDLTCRSFEPVYNLLVKRANAAIESGTEDPMELRQITLFQFLNYNRKRLELLLKDVGDWMPRLKKGVQLHLAPILCTIIWSWITEYPSEFVDLQKEGKCLHAQCPVIFEAYATLGEKASRKNVCWPIQTRTMLLCPDSMMEIHNDASSTSSSTTAMKKHLDLMRKALLQNTKSVAEVAIRSFIDLCIASTYVDKQTTTCCLRYLVPPIEAELKLQLFNLKTPFFANVNEEEERLLVSCMVACFRLNSRSMLSGFFVPFLSGAVDGNEGGTPMILRLIVIKSLLAILKLGDSGMKWNPTIENTYAQLSRPCRILLHELIRKLRAFNSTSAGQARSKTKKEARLQADHALELKVLESLIQLFHDDPTFAFHHEANEYDAEEDNKRWYPTPNCDRNMYDTLVLMSGFVECLEDPSLSDVSDSAASTLIKLNNVEWVEKWNPSNPMPSFWDISCNVFIRIAIQLIGQKAVNFTQLLTCVKELLALRNDFLRSRQGVVEGSCTPIHIQTRNRLEVVLLTSLYSCEPEVLAILGDCFALLCEEADILLEPTAGGELETDFLQANLSVARSLAKAGHMETGYRAQQKRIMSLLRRMEIQTAGNLAAWDGLFSRWNTMAEKIIRKNPEEEPVTELPAEWISMTGLLCALGGVCVMSEDSTSYDKFGTGNNKTLIGSARKVKMFHERLLELLVCEMDDVGAQIRKTVVDAVGQELNATLFPMFFGELNSTVSKFFHGSKGGVTVSEANTLFVDQAIKIVSALLSSKIASAAEHLVIVDIETLVQSFVDYLRQMPADSDLQTKEIACNLVTKIMEKRNILTFRHEMKFRNSLVEKLMDFMGANQVGDSKLDSAYKKSKLEVACMNAIASLLLNLPIQPTYDDMSDQIEAKSKLFSKYFTFFMNITNRCRARAPDRKIVEEDIVVRSGTVSRKVMSQEKLDVGNRAFQRDRLGKNRAFLREASCQAMSNLLSANIDVGLGHSISMGYHEDVGVRLAFVEVLTKVLKQGTEFDTLAETVLSDRYARLVQLVVEPSLRIVMALTAAIPADMLEEFAHLVGHLFEACQAGIPFFFRIAKWEVKHCASAQTLFRRNSLATKVASLFMNSHQSVYLQRTLKPVLESMISKGNVSYEIDPTRLKEGEKIEENLPRLLAVVKQFLDAILQSVEYTPFKFRMLCHGIRIATEETYPDAANNAVGGLVFLRFFTPSMVSPRVHGLCEDNPPPAVNRGLILASKILQAVANSAPFKESFMQSMNAFVDESIPKLKEFLDKVSARPDEIDHATLAECHRFGVLRSLPSSTQAPPSSEFDPTERPDVKEADLHSLHRFVVDHIEKIGRELTLSASGKQALDSSDVSGTALFDKLTTLIAQLGDPPKIEQSQRRSSMRLSNQSKGNQFDEFLTKHKFLETSTETIQAMNLFFDAGESKARRPVFYFIARRYVAAQVDTEQLMFYLLSTLKLRLGSPFELVLDLTTSNRTNEPPPAVVERFLSLLPAEAADNLAVIHIFGPSTWFRNFTKRWTRVLLATKMYKKVRFYSSLAELQEQISEAAIPPSSIRLLEQVHEFPNVARLGDNRKSTPVVVRAGAASFQIVSGDKVTILRSNVNSIDVYAISSISEIRQTREDGHDTVVVDYNQGSEMVKLQGQDIDALFRSIHDIWARHLLSEPSTKGARKVIRPANVPGTMLNMALLNLGSPDPALRLAAYNFLAALTTTFDFHIGGELLEASGLAIPQNNTNFIIRISEYLAKNEARLTLEFLDECIAGLSSSSREQKHLCLEYMQPWLPNVKEFAPISPEKALKIIRGLVNVTIVEQELYPSLQAKVWYTIGKVDELVEQVVDRFLATATEGGPGSKQATIMADAAVTLAEANVSIVSRRIIDEFLLKLGGTSQNSKSNLVEHVTWPDIEVLIRFLLMLSFNNRLDVQRNLPDILHIITMIIASGPPHIRATVHGIAVNIVQSMCTTMTLDEEAVLFIRVRLTEMMQPKFCLHFGMSGAQGRNLIFSSAPGGSKERSTSDNFNQLWLQSVVDVLWETMSVCSEHSAAWRERWVALATSSAFTENSALQPRAFITLGVIAGQLTPDLVPNLLKTLSMALVQIDVVLIESIMHCLTRLLRIFPGGSFYHKAFFWIALSILQIGEVKIFSSALAVVETALNSLAAHGAFTNESVEAIFMHARKPIHSLCEKLDRSSGVNFDTSFSFAIVTLLAKGFNHEFPPSTIARTIRVLMAFLNFEQLAENVALTRGMLGYTAAVLPCAEEARETLLEESDIPDDEKQYTAILNSGVLDDTTSVLLICTMCAQLQHTRVHSEKKFIFHFLSRAAPYHPQIFQLVENFFLELLFTTLNETQDHQVVASCHTILRTLAKARTDGSINGECKSLEQLGFSGLVNAGAYTNRAIEDQRVNASICRRVIEEILKQATQTKDVGEDEASKV